MKFARHCAAALVLALACSPALAEAPAADIPERIARRMEEGFTALGMPTRLSGLNIERGKLAEVLEHSLKNFNADPKRDFVKERDLLAALLESAW